MPRNALAVQLACSHKPPGIAQSRPTARRRGHAGAIDEYGYSRRWRETSLPARHVQNGERPQWGYPLHVEPQHERGTPQQRHRRSVVDPPPAAGGNRPGHRQSSIIRPVYLLRGPPVGSLRTWHWVPRRAVHAAGGGHSETLLQSCNQPRASHDRWSELMHRGYRDSIAAPPRTWRCAMSRMYPAWREDDGYDRAMHAERRDCGHLQSRGEEQCWVETQSRWMGAR